MLYVINIVLKKLIVIETYIEFMHHVVGIDELYLLAWLRLL